MLPRRCAPPFAGSLPSLWSPADANIHWAQGKRIFRDALDDGSVESFFPLVQHFQTQSEPASCALGTLCMARCTLHAWLHVVDAQLSPPPAGEQVLNACGIDPGQSWKGPWRWWSEEARGRRCNVHLNTCIPPEPPLHSQVLLQRWDTATEGLPHAQRRAVADVRGAGMSLAEFTLLSRASGLHAVGRRADSSTKGAFQEAVWEALGCGVGCGSSHGGSQLQPVEEEHRHTPFGGRGGTHVVASFDRAALRQTGQGHFSPLGGYSRRHGAVLVMDVARFKYPPYWCSLDALWEAMLLPDPATGVSRGYVVLKATDIPRDSDRCPVGGLLPPPQAAGGMRPANVKGSGGGHSHSYAHSPDHSHGAA